LDKTLAHNDISAAADLQGAPLLRAGQGNAWSGKKAAISQPNQAGWEIGLHGWKERIEAMQRICNLGRCDAWLPSCPGRELRRRIGRAKPLPNAGDGIERRLSWRARIAQEN
jgi:hypothetical protein